MRSGLTCSISTCNDETLAFQTVQMCCKTVKETANLNEGRQSYRSEAVVKGNATLAE